MTPDATERSFVVVGGGITGLAAAWTLRTEAPGARITLLEASDRLGGKIRTGELAGSPFELGPDAFVPSAETEAMCDALGLGDRLIEPAVFGAYLWTRKGLRRVPEGSPWGIPGYPTRWMRSGLLSVPGTVRALFEPLVRRRIPRPDESVGGFLQSRLGSEVVEAAVAPMLRAIRNGDPFELGLEETIPWVHAAATRRRSILGELRRMRRAGDLAEPSFRSIDGGLERLVDAMAAAARADVWLREPATRVYRRGGWLAVRVERGDEVPADGVVVTSAPAAAARVLREITPDAATELDAIRYGSGVVVGLVYPRGSVKLPPDGSGFVVPPASGRALVACSWYSRKWPRSAPSSGDEVLRCFVRTESTAGQDDARIVEDVTREIELALSPAAPPLSSVVARWDRALPQYVTGHLSRVARIDAAIALVPGLEIAGAGYRGPGVAECVASGRSAARGLLEQIGR